MPTSTLELPCEMVEAARRYAASEHRTVIDLFADMMKTRYGFTMKIVVSAEKRSSDHKRRVPIPDMIKSISGIVSLSDGVTENDVVCDAVMAN